MNLSRSLRVNARSTHLFFVPAAVRPLQVMSLIFPSFGLQRPHLPLTCMAGVHEPVCHVTSGQECRQTRTQQHVAGCRLFTRNQVELVEHECGSEG